MEKNSTPHNVKQAVPFFMVKDMKQSLNFYLTQLGFELKNKWEPLGKIEWCWLEIGNAALMLQEYGDNAPTTKLGEGVSVCFICDDALSIYREVLKKGTSTVMEPFVGNGLWVVHYRDPDGYNIFFESQTDEPEETVLSSTQK